MPQNLTDDKSTLAQVMVWCRQATSHYMNQCWPRSPTPYGVTRPHWVNSMSIGLPIPEIQIFQNFTLKIQGQSHRWGHARSHSGSNILLTQILFISSCQMALAFLRYGYFKIGPWKSKDQSHRWGQSQGHIVDPLSIQCTYFLFHVNLSIGPNIPKIHPIECVTKKSVKEQKKKKNLKKKPQGVQRTTTPLSP